MNKKIAASQISLALFEPDIPGNTGTLMRLCACFSVHIHIIEPCGFILEGKKFKRSAMDYLKFLSYSRHNSWLDFLDFTKQSNSSIVLLSTKSKLNYLDYRFKQTDILLLGRESSGVTSAVLTNAKVTLMIKMKPNLRSINVALAGAIVLSEAMRQLGRS